MKDVETLADRRGRSQGARLDRAAQVTKRRFGQANPRRHKLLDLDRQLEIIGNDRTEPFGRTSLQSKPPTEVQFGKIRHAVSIAERRHADAKERADIFRKPIACRSIETDRGSRCRPSAIIQREHPMMENIEKTYERQVIEVARA